MSMTHGTRGSDEANPPRPPSVHSTGSSGSGSSKHVRCIGRYVLTGESLGKGNFARVETAVHTLTRGKVAVKIIETDKIKEDYVRKNLLREAQLMRRLRHPNIIRLYETMKTNNLYCLVTEIAEGGELLSHVRNDFKEKKLSEATARPFIRQLVSALYHLHSSGIVHRDLKMENILLDKKKRNVKVVDFGLSNAQKPGALLQTHCGSPEYAAPELFIPGREYGPEVDVWSLGVNMYAMLVGKLPFRSPRQGTRRRQKLLEQISGGLTENHEKEMLHVSAEARDLIGRLLQPDPRKRVGLNEAMLHPWITKEGTQPLHPFNYIPPDATTRKNIVDLMSSVLEVSLGEIKETVRRDRCDWLAAIYNLLLDQPEGMNILQRLVTDDPDDQLEDAAHYQGSIEHLRLSQGEMLDQVPPEVADVLTSTTARRGPSGYRHSLHGTVNEYESATLPITKKERKRRHSHSQGHGPRPLGVPQTLKPVQPPPGYSFGRRASIASPGVSPERQIVVLHPGDPNHGNRGRRLPMTPTIEPYQQRSQPDQQQPPMRPHSRAESTPDPLPVPWRPKLAPQISTSPTHSQQTIPRPLQEETNQHAAKYKDTLVSPLSNFKPNKRRTSLNPIRPKSVALSQNLSMSVGSDLHKVPPSAGIAMPGVHTLSGNMHMWKGSQQVVPLRRPGHDGIMGAQLGWASIESFPVGSENFESASTTSVEIKTDLFQTNHSPLGSGNPSPQGLSPTSSLQNSRAHFRSGDNLKVDLISGEHKHHRAHTHHNPVMHRSVSAKPQRSGSLYPPEMSNSAHLHPPHHEDFAFPGSRSGRRHTVHVTGILGKFRSPKGTGEKSAPQSLRTKA